MDNLRKADKKNEHRFRQGDGYNQKQMLNTGTWALVTQQSKYDFEITRASWTSEFGRLQWCNAKWLLESCPAMDRLIFRKNITMEYRYSCISDDSLYLKLGLKNSKENNLKGSWDIHHEFLKQKILSSVQLLFWNCLLLCGFHMPSCTPVLVSCYGDMSEGKY